MRLLFTLLLIPTLAWGQLIQTVSLATCTSGTCTSTDTRTLKEKDILVVELTGTMDIDVECVNSGGAPTHNARATVTATDATPVAYDRPCWEMQVSVNTCTACTYSVHVTGFTLN